MKLKAKVTPEGSFLEEVNPYNRSVCLLTDKGLKNLGNFESTKKSWITDDLNLVDGQEVDSDDYEFVWQRKLALNLTESVWVDQDKKPLHFEISRQIARKIVKEVDSEDYDSIKQIRNDFGIWKDADMPFYRHISDIRQIYRKKVEGSKCNKSYNINSIKIKEDKETPEQAAKSYVDFKGFEDAFLAGVNWQKQQDK